jgi:hypothetical protein
MRRALQFTLTLLAVTTHCSSVSGVAKSQSVPGQVDCAIRTARYEYGGKKLFTPQQSVDLCRGGGTDETVQCAITAVSYEYGGTNVFTPGQSVDLCRDGGSDKTAQCAITAVRYEYGGTNVFTPGQSVDLCKSR